MDELEVSKTLKPLTARRAADWFNHQKKEMGKTAVSVYLFIAQDGLRQANLTFQRYCDEIGIEERTARYWIQRVKATLIVSDITDLSLLSQYEMSEFNTALVPTVAAGEILRILPDQAREAWREWSAIRNEPTLATKGNAASFRRIVDRKFPRQESETVSDSEDQNRPKTDKTEVVVTVSNTQYTGPICGGCGDACKEGELLCDDCIADAVAPDPLNEEDAMGPRVDVPEEKEDWGNEDTEEALTNEEVDRMYFSEDSVDDTPRLMPPMKSIAVLTVCSATKTGTYPEIYILRQTDGNGKEYTAVLTQRHLDLATIGE